MSKLAVSKLDLTRLEPKLIERILASRAKSTWARYEKALARLAAWCERHGEPSSVPMEPEVVARWISALADEGLSSSTLGVSAAAVSALHETAGLESPCRHPQVKALIRGARRERAESHVVAQADPILPKDLRRMVGGAFEAHPAYERNSALLARDLAILLFGWAGGFRRSELAGLRLDDLRFGGEGGAVVVTLDRSKNRVGEPHERRIVAADQSDLCPVRALNEWLMHSGIVEGHIFRAFERGRITTRPVSGSLVDLVVRRFARAIPRELGRQPRFSAHSLRAGLATTAALADKPDRDIADHLNHRSVATTQRYVRTARVRKSELTKGLL